MNAGTDAWFLHPLQQFGRVGRRKRQTSFKNHLVKLKLGFKTEPVEELRECSCRNVNICRGMAANAKVEGSCLATDLGVVARITVAVMNADSSELVVNGFENLLAKEGHILDDVRVSACQDSQSGFSVCEVRCKL